MERVYGPYYDKDRGDWKVIFHRDDGRRSARRFKTEADALEAASEAQKRIGIRSVADAWGAYVMYLRERGRESGTLTTTEIRLAGLCDPLRLLPVAELTPARCRTLYRTYAGGGRAPATHHGALKQAKSWGRWMVEKRGWLKVNPWALVEPIGEKATGKEQLNTDDLARLYAWCAARAQRDDGACAILVAMLLGLRSSEILSLTPRHLDVGGLALRVKRSKTRAGVRATRLPRILVDALGVRAKKVTPTSRILPYSRWWLLSQLEAACDAAGVSRITTHALRGSNATELAELGLSPEALAKHLGHADKGRTAREAYLQDGAGRSHHAEQLASLLEQLGKNLGQNLSPASDDESDPQKGE